MFAFLVNVTPTVLYNIKTVVYIVTAYPLHIEYVGYGGVCGSTGEIPLSIIYQQCMWAVVLFMYICVVCDVVYC